MGHVLSVVGTRPEAIKMAPLIRALQQESWVRSTVVLTAQHRSLLDQALGAFGVEAQIDLNLMQPGQSLGQITSRAFAALEPVLREQKPDLVLAQGDTTTVMVAAVSCFYLGIPFGHVEAGLRTGDLQNPFPEEANRVFVGRVAALHFAPTPHAAAALRREGVAEESVLVSGNTVIDALLYTRDHAPRLDLDLPKGSRLMLVTSHRRENFGAPMDEAFGAIRCLADERPDLHVLYPVHPNPNVVAAAYRHFRGHPRIHLREPMDYAAFTAAMQAADVILTDSGGVQEEAPALGKPVLVMRKETERPEAVASGVVKLVGTDREAIVASVSRLLDDPAAYAAMARGVSPYGDGRASQRIVERIARFFGRKAPAGGWLSEFGG
jgi:UDP-N-acetylglucosamine 2-epimerase (non-hydrolysing)